MPISNATSTDGDLSIGARLRVARESRGIQLADIAGTLCIKPQFLAALEADQPEALPTPTHASGFLRSYARYLGVDIANANIAPPPPRDIAPLTATPSRPAAWATALPPLLVIGGLVGLYALWQWLQPAEPAPIAPPPAALTAPKLEPLEPTIEPKAEIKAEIKAEPKPAETPAVQQPETAANPQSDVKTDAPVAVLEKLTAAAQPAPAGKPDSVTVRAIADAWVQITDASGRQLYSRLMRRGESWRAPQQAGLRLSTGNAGGLNIIRNGEAGPPLGSQAQVLRNLQLTQPFAAVAKPAAAATTNSIAAPIEDGTADSADNTADLEE